MTAALLTILISLFTSNTNASEILFSDNFEKSYDSVIYQYLKAHGHDAIVSRNIGTDKSNGLRVKYVSIYKGSTRVKGFFKLLKKTNEASLSYDVLFEEDFLFVLGGKLHGLAPDNVVTGNWKKRPDGWSSRITFKKNGKIGTLLALQNDKQKWGASKKNDKFKFKRGKYYAITLYTKLNSGPNKNNGEARIYVNGQLLVKHKNAQFWKAKDKESRISQFLFSTFHGGGTKDWAPKDKSGNFKNVHAIFDNFTVTQGLKVKTKPGL